MFETIADPLTWSAVLLLCVPCAWTPRKGPRPEERHPWER